MTWRVREALGANDALEHSVADGEHSVRRVRSVRWCGADPVPMCDDAARF